MVAPRKLLLSILILAPMLAAGCAAAPDAELVEEWRTIPIMPGATIIETADDKIVYEISSPLPEIGAFYVPRLEAAGWSYLGLGEGIGGLFLVHSRGEQHLEISVYGAIDVERTRVVISLR